MGERTLAKQFLSPYSSLFAWNDTCEGRTTKVKHTIDTGDEVFLRLKDAGLKLNPKKCSLFQKEVKYLGHRVSEKGVFMDEDKVKAVQDWPRPTNLNELRSFLGICTYYRRFVPCFAMLRTVCMI